MQLIGRAIMLYMEQQTTPLILVRRLGDQAEAVLLPWQRDFAHWRCGEIAMIYEGMQLVYV